MPSADIALEPPTDRSTAKVAQDREAFTRLARESAPLLIQIARRLCPFDEDTAQDLVQHTLVGAYERLLKNQFVIGPGSRRWLVRALTNEFLQRLRKDKRLTWNNEAADLHPDPQMAPDAFIDQEDRTTLLNQALLALDPDQRACLVLVDLQELDYQSAADALGIPVGTVRSRLSRARMKIAAELVKLKEEQTQ